MFIIIVFWIGSDSPSGLLVISCPLYFFPYSPHFSYLLRLFLCPGHGHGAGLAASKPLPVSKYAAPGQ